MRVEAEWWIRGIVGLSIAKLVIGQIRPLAANGPAQMPEMDADLIGTAGNRTNFDERRTVSESASYAKFGSCGLPLLVDGAPAKLGGSIADRGVAHKRTFRRMPLNAGEVKLLYFASRKLGL